MRFGIHLLFTLILAAWSVRVLGPVDTWESRITAEAAAAQTEIAANQGVRGPSIP